LKSTILKLKEVLKLIPLRSLRLKMEKKRKKKAKKVKKLKNQRRKVLSLLKTLRKKASFNVISSKEEVKRPSARSQEWIIILKISNQSLPNLVKSSVVDVHKPSMKFMVNALPSKVTLNTIYGSSLIPIKN